MFLEATSNEDSGKETQQFANIITFDQDVVVVGITEWNTSSPMTEQNANPCTKERKATLPFVIPISASHCSGVIAVGVF